jgi:Sulfotransferase family
VQISTSHRFIFVHIFKTAGTSVRSALNPYVDRREYLLWNFIRRRLGFPPPDPYPGLSSHAHADEIQAALPPEIFKTYFKFAFVRNPWDLQVSMYNYIMRWRAHHEHAAISKLGSFEEFLRYRIDHPTWSQKCFVADKSGTQIIDFVGRFENIDADFNHVCERIDIDTRLPRLNRSKHDDYRTYYNEVRRVLVERICGEDISYFGYGFDPAAGGETRMTKPENQTRMTNDE